MLEVSRSGYYEWLGRKPSLRRQQDQALKRRLLSLHQRYPALGLDSLYHLIRSELACSRKRIHRLMNELNISSARKRAYKATTNSRHAHPIAPNLLARQFSFDAPNKAWVGDITYIPTDEGWLYCAIVKDLCTKQIIGYAFSERIDTNLTLAALNAASADASPILASSSTLTAASNMPPALTDCVSLNSVSGKVCPARATLMTTPLPRTSSAVSNASASICAISLQGHMLWRTSLLISRLFTTRCVRIPLLAGVLRTPLRVLYLSIPPPE